MNEKILMQILCVLVARTWERIRITQEHEEMPQDNIESIDTIRGIADKIYCDPNVVMNAKQWWVINTDMMSDSYVEERAEKIIRSFL